MRRLLAATIVLTCPLIVAATSISAPLLWAPAPEMQAHPAAAAPEGRTARKRCKPFAPGDTHRSGSGDGWRFFLRNLVLALWGAAWLMQNRAERRRS